MNILKGAVPQTLRHSLSVNVAMAFGDPNFRFTEGGLYILFLSGGVQGAELVPDIPIPVAANIKLPTAVPSTSPSDQGRAAITEVIVQLLLDSLQDPDTRVADMYVLRTVRNKTVVQTARAALSDPNVDMQRNALCCLAENQIVEVIPRIAEMIDQTEVTSPEARRLFDAIRVYEVPEATPFLNQLLLSKQLYVRQFAAMTLSQKHLADETSLPFLLENYTNPASKGLGLFYVDVMLHGLIPTLGAHGDQGHPEQHRAAEINAVQSWWDDEKAGKHRLSGPSTVPAKD